MLYKDRILNCLAFKCVRSLLEQDNFGVHPERKVFVIHHRFVIRFNRVVQWFNYNCKPFSEYAYPHIFQFPTKGTGRFYHPHGALG